MRTAVAVVAVAFVVGTVAAHAQRPAVPPAPPDVAAAPADAERLPNGLASKVITPGTGTDKALPTDVVTVHYTGWTADGKLIDSSHARGQTATFPITRVIAGWRECVQLMTVGETRRCWVPQALGYRGRPGRPQGLTVFDIELVDTHGSPNIPPPDVAAPPEDARKTASGIAYKVLRPGIGGRKPAAWQRVTVHYTGWTTDGKMFDTSLNTGQPTTLSLEDVIKGWTEGVGLMVEGERSRFWIPEDLAYKGEGDGPKGMLVFDIDLVRIEN